MQILKNVVCPGCTCLCDDLEISRSETPRENGLLQFKNACSKGERWFQQRRQDVGHVIDGQPADWTTALVTAKRLLSQSDAPLICGLDHLSTAAQQSAWRLADRIGATIDTSISNAGRGSMFALQRIGKVTATLGEIATRANLVVFWFCDPASTHPRHLERYSQPANGHPRKIVVIDNRRTKTAEIADSFIELSPESTGSALAIMRATITGMEKLVRPVDVNSKLDPSVWIQLAERLSNTQYGALFYGHATQEGQFDLMSDSLASMGRELNQRTRFVSLALRDDANAQSAENVLAWSSGFPFAVNLNRRFPRSCWLEHSAQSILERAECDLILLGSNGGIAEQMTRLSKSGQIHFNQTPKIMLNETVDRTFENVKVQFSVSQTGSSSAGDYCRQDDVSLKLSAIQPSTDLPSAEELLAQFAFANDSN